MRALAAWALPARAGAVERAAEGIAQPIEIRGARRARLRPCARPATAKQLVTDQGWPGWSPPLAARRLALESLRAQLDEPGPGGVVRPARTRSPRSGHGSPARSTHRFGSLDEWLADDASADERRQAAARATRWLSAFLRMTSWPLPPRTNLDATCRLAPR